MPLKRTTHWATREFDHFLRHEAHHPFVWGQHDCCTFAANAVRAFTGVDLAEDFRGKYHDEASAFALIKSVTGGTTVEDAAAWCAEKHGLVEWVRDGKPAPLFAQRGDLVVLEDAGRLIAGVMHLRGTHAVSVSAEGRPVKLSIRCVKRAWKI